MAVPEVEGAAHAPQIEEAVRLGIVELDPLGRPSTKKKPRSWIAATRRG